VQFVWVVRGHSALVRACGWGAQRNASAQGPQPKRNKMYFKLDNFIFLGKK
jgi:hypothetical protein